MKGDDRKRSVPALPTKKAVLSWSAITITATILSLLTGLWAFWSQVSSVIRLLVIGVGALLLVLVVLRLWEDVIKALWTRIHQFDDLLEAFDHQSQLLSLANKTLVDSYSLGELIHLAIAGGAKVPSGFEIKVECSFADSLPPETMALVVHTNDDELFGFASYTGRVDLAGRAIFSFDGSGLFGSMIVKANEEGRLFEPPAVALLKRPDSPSNSQTVGGEQA